MKIYICVKHAPSSAANLEIVGKTISDEIPYLINPHDEVAINVANQLKQNHSELEIIVVSLGKLEAVDTIRSVLAMGADRAIHILGCEKLRSIQTAKLLKLVIDDDGGIGKNDLVLTGKESVDQEGMQTMFRLAYEFKVPAVTNIVYLKKTKDTLLAHSEIESGSKEVIQLTRPVVLGVAQGDAKIKYPTIPEIIRSRKKIIKTIKLKDLLSEPQEEEIINISSAFENRKQEEIKGTPEEMVLKLVDILKSEAKVI